MVNLRNIANRATRSINPNITAIARICTGYTTAANGKQAPTYAPDTTITIQAQALTKHEIEHLDSLNISNADRAVYANMQLTGVDRTTQSGGDLLVFEGATWLVIAVLEGWPTSSWSKVAVRRQLG